MQHPRLHHRRQNILSIFEPKTTTAVPSAALPAASAAPASASASAAAVSVAASAPASSATPTDPLAGLTSAIGSLFSQPTTSSSSSSSSSSISTPAAAATPTPVTPVQHSTSTATLDPLTVTATSVFSKTAIQSSSSASASPSATAPPTQSAAISKTGIIIAGVLIGVISLTLFVGFIMRRWNRRRARARESIYFPSEEFARPSMPAAGADRASIASELRYEDAKSPYEFDHSAAAAPLTAPSIYHPESPAPDFGGQQMFSPPPQAPPRTFTPQPQPNGFPSAAQHVQMTYHDQQQPYQPYPPPSHDAYGGM